MTDLRREDEEAASFNRVDAGDRQALDAKFPGMPRRKRSSLREYPICQGLPGKRWRTVGYDREEAFWLEIGDGSDPVCVRERR